MEVSLLARGLHDKVEGDVGVVLVLLVLDALDIGGWLSNFELEVVLVKLVLLDLGEYLSLNSV